MQSDYIGKKCEFLAQTRGFAPWTPTEGGSAPLDPPGLILGLSGLKLSTTRHAHVRGGTFSIVLAHRAPARMRVRVLDVCGCGCSTLPLMQNPGVVPRISQGRGLQRGGATGRHERVGSPAVLGSANTHARFARARVASLPGLPLVYRAQLFRARRARTLP